MNYVEDVNGIDYFKYFWGNVVWVLVQCIIEVFVKYGWCVVICGVEGGGVVEGLLVYMFCISFGDLLLKCLIEVVIIDCCEKEFNDFGFIFLCYKKNSDVVVFFGGQIINKVRFYNINEVNVNVCLLVMLLYVLVVLCFVYYLKVIMCDKVGSFMICDNVQIYLNNWIVDYVLINDNVLQEIKVQYLLCEVWVDVSEVVGKLGVYCVMVFFWLYFQFEEFSVLICLVVNLLLLVVV